MIKVYLIIKHGSEHVLIQNRKLNVVYANAMAVMQQLIIDHCQLRRVTTTKIRTEKRLRANSIYAAMDLVCL